MPTFADEDKPETINSSHRSTSQIEPSSIIDDVIEAVIMQSDNREIEISGSTPTRTAPHHHTFDLQ